MTVFSRRFILVRARGLEPPRPEGHQNLNLTRLPNYGTRALSSIIASPFCLMNPSSFNRFLGK